MKNVKRVDKLVKNFLAIALRNKVDLFIWIVKVADTSVFKLLVFIQTCTKFWTPLGTSPSEAPEIAQQVCLLLNFLPLTQAVSEYDVKKKQDFVQP